MPLYLGLGNNLNPVQPVGPQPFPGIGGTGGTQQQQAPPSSVFSSPTQGDQNNFPSEAVRNTNFGSQFDPQYMQNMATYIGGLFARPQGQLGFNPLGNLSEISPPSGFGNAPLPGLPPTLLNNALSGFPFGPSQSSGASGGAGTSTGDVSGSGSAPASAAAGFPDTGAGVLGEAGNLSPFISGGLPPQFFGSGFNPNDLYDPFGAGKAAFGFK